MLIEKVKVDPQEKREPVTDNQIKKQRILRQEESSHSTQVGRRFTGFQKIYHLMSDVVLK